MTIKTGTVGIGMDAHTRYFIKDGDSDICWFDDLKTAGIVSRFLKGSHMDRADYAAARDALEEWDTLHSLPKGETANDREQTAGNTGPVDMQE